MKLLKYIFVAIIGSLLLTACEDDVNLKRDNPLDEENNADGTWAQVAYDSHTVVSDNNGNGIINKGETIYLFVNLKNKGTGRANKVKATFSTTSSYALDLTPATQVNYGDIPAGKKQGYDYGVYGYISSEDYTVKFTVSNTTPDNTKIPIDISITDENDNTWTDSFEVTVEKTGAQIDYDSHTVVSDNNGNGIINKGETIYLFVNLKNNGSSTANKVKATFSTTSSYALDLTPATQVNYGDISAGNKQGYDYGYVSYYGGKNYTVKFTVSSTTPDNTKIPIDIIITDENDNTWTDSFEVTVEKIGAQIDYDSHTVVSDNNGNGIINKGETIYLFVNLKNNGSSTANKVKATFSTTSSYALDLTPATQVNYGDISAGNKQGYDYGYVSYYGGKNYTVKFTVSSTTPDNTKIPIDINITDESGNTWTDSFEVTVEKTGAQIDYDGHTVVSDSNGNGIVNKGETIYLFVNLKNNGSSTANKVKATFSTTNPYVSDFVPTAQVNYGNISAGKRQNDDYGVYGYTYIYYDSEDYTVKFTVSNTTPSNTEIIINIKIVDESNNTWSNSFNVTVRN